MEFKDGRQAGRPDTASRTLGLGDLATLPVGTKVRCPGLYGLPFRAVKLKDGQWVNGRTGLPIRTDMMNGAEVEDEDA